MTIPRQRLPVVLAERTTSRGRRARTPPRACEVDPFHPRAESTRTVVVYGFSILGEVMSAGIFPAFQAQWVERALRRARADLDHLRDRVAMPFAQTASGKIGQRLRLWSAGCSTGEEPYSIAMTAVEAFGSFRPPVSILATDIDTQVLAEAQAGVYPLDRLEKMSPERVRRFFLKESGAREGYVKVRPELQRLITFRPLNLLEKGWFVRGPQDAIFCRNVMIYFDKPTQATILHRFAPLMRNDALLFAGHSESLFHVSALFQLLGRTVYRLTGGTPGGPG